MEESYTKNCRHPFSVTQVEKKLDSRKKNQEKKKNYDTRKKKDLRKDGKGEQETVRRTSLVKKKKCRDSPIRENHEESVGESPPRQAAQPLFFFFGASLVCLRSSHIAKRTILVNRCPKKGKTQIDSGRVEGTSWRIEPSQTYLFLVA